MVFLSVVLALTAAACLALGAVLQQSAAADVPVTPVASSAGRGGGGLLRSLATRPLWLVGQLVGGAGIVLFAVALHLGEVVVVQPLLACQVVFSLALVSVRQRRATGRWGVGRGQWASAAIAVAGLLLFQIAARPASGGSADVQLLGIAVALALVVDAFVVLCAARLRPRARGLAFALAAGAGFGVDALLIKEVAAQVAAGHLFSWALLGLVVLATTSVVLAQRAFQTGLVAAVLPAITSMEPVVAIALAGPVFAENLASGGAARTLQLFGLTGLVIGVLALARAEGRATPPSIPPPSTPAADTHDHTGRTRVLADAGSAR